MNPTLKGAAITLAIMVVGLYVLGHTDMGKKYLGLKPDA